MGQEALIEAIVVACLAKGNVLLEGSRVWERQN